ncbi:hypothetical protein TRAPUB_6557 [Trametes pubescens]|uniref:Transcription factor BYE1 n=1 Tax=Trametes pubescens TaxID=154538 RepID=A0A1M2V5S7_TRAPU|nr:hypothetical protein TRAPUB_6557 [Trametes pubescens]
MSTRSAVRTRQASRADTSNQASQEAAPAAQDEKENVKMNGPSGRARVTRKSSSKPYCICKKPDDGSPMIHCTSCKDWFHFRCVELSEKDADEIQVWEGPEAVQEVLVPNDHASTPSSSTRSKKKSTAKQVAPKVKAEALGSSSESEAYSPRPEAAPKTRARRQAYKSDDESDSGASHRATSPKRLRHTGVAPKEPAPHKQPSPAVTTQQKRKQSASSQPQPPSKRPRSESTSGDDAIRKYCLGKLHELFCQIFTRYPFLPSAEGEHERSGELVPDKKPEELTLEEKEQLETKARQAGTDLEQSIYELYAEPDKQGKQVAAGKYKERFRMLTFNLSKADRVVLHMRIASSHISPKELSTMSSTDLASAEEQQSIKKLEEEALAHSILKKATVPRAKLTHKGLQDIEDVTGAGRLEAEREREDEEAARIERERLARLRLQAQRAQSVGSAPPESPIAPHNPAWGAPPPVPLHAGADMSPSPSSTRPLFVPSASDYAAAVSMEHELNLADLINIDEEPSGEIAMTPVDTVPTPFGEVPPLLVRTTSDHASPSTASPVTPATTGISPFAAKGSPSDLSSRPSFDLNALWTPSSSDHPMEGQASASPEPQDAPDAMVTEPTGDELELDTEDQDFDMFLNGNDQDAESKQEPPAPVEPAPEAKPATFEDHPTIWSGTVSMPLDSAIPQEVAVIARQTGGRTLGHNSPLWRTLFPSGELRIDGRVPVEKSAQYLTQVRLNPTKELIAAAFSPADGSDPSGFHAVKNHLLSKSRHGLIFPWGHNPKSSAPGRELYIVPLLSSDPIPEYMELLDQLQFPPTRNVDYLVGIWVLNKGKLAPPPTAPAPVAAPAHAATPPPASAPMPVPVPQPQAAPNLDLAQLHQLGLLQPPPPSQPPPPPPPSQSAPPIPPPSHPAPYTSPPPSNLAAEVAQLTPEQIQLMLQTLAKTAPVPVPHQPHSEPYGIPLPVHAMTPAHGQPQPVSIPQPIALPQAALQSWSSPNPPAPSQYPAPYPQQHPPHQQGPPPPFPGAQQPYGAGGGYDRNERPYQNHGNTYEYDRGGREFRGGRGGRGRGGNGGGGWQKPRGRGGPAGRNRGRGGGGGWGGEQR